jgi:hypothetical protein
VRSSWRGDELDAWLRDRFPPPKPKPDPTAEHREPLLHSRVEMFPHHSATGLDVKVNDQEFAACYVRADSYDSSLARDRILVHFAGSQHFIMLLPG